MKALSGDFPTKAGPILAAGCDLVLHCNGVMEEMSGIASRTGVLAGASLRAPSARWRATGRDDGKDEAEIRAEFAGYFDAVA